MGWGFFFWFCRSTVLPLGRPKKKNSIILIFFFGNKIAKIFHTDGTKPIKYTVGSVLQVGSRRPAVVVKIHGTVHYTLYIIAQARIVV